MPDHRRDWWADPGPVGWSDGAPHVATAEQVWATIESHLDRFGITRVADLTGLDTVGVPVAAAYRPNARSLSVSQGKGLTWAAARVSAAMEALEHAHAEQVVAPLRRASLADLRGEGAPVIDLARLPRHAEASIAEHHDLLWLAGRVLSDPARTVWVPLGIVSLDRTTQGRSLDLGWARDSNGLASGITSWEAVHHGLCEVVERDAAAWWWVSADPDDTVVDPSTVPDVGAAAALGKCHAADLLVVCHDATHDVGVPVMRVEIVERVADPFRALPVAVGLGCHPHPGVALARAVTEATQTRMVHVSGARDDLDRQEFSSSHDAQLVQESRSLMEQTARMARPWAPGPTALPRWCDEPISTGRPDLAEDSRQIARRLVEIGCGESVVVDLTRPDGPVSVVKVIVPGLEGAWAVGSADLAPGERYRTWVGDPR